MQHEEKKSPSLKTPIIIKILNVLQIIVSLPYLIFLITWTLGMVLFSLNNNANAYGAFGWTISLLPFAILMLFSNPYIFFGFTGAAIVISVSILVYLVKTFKVQSFKKWRIYFSVILLIFVGLPLIYLGNYEAPLKAKANTQLYLVNDFNYFEKVIGNMNRSSEGKDYDYELLGWADNNTLVYKKFKNNYVFGTDYRKTQPPTLLDTKYYSISENKTASYKENAKFYNSECKFDACVKPYLANSNVILEKASKDKEAIISPDGNYVAFMGKAWYGPYDIMIIKIK